MLLPHGPALRPCGPGVRLQGFAPVSVLLPAQPRPPCRLVAEHGEGNWSAIAKHFPGRIGKQCRERWHNQLRPDIKRDAWSATEEQLLINAHRDLGNKCAAPTVLPSLSHVVQLH